MGDERAISGLNLATSTVVFSPLVVLTIASPLLPPVYITVYTSRFQAVQLRETIAQVSSLRSASVDIPDYSAGV